ncbi:MAG: hypothetical protein ACD_79C00561G0003 [uncultured bacterium]|nr:MAG: hypothetical protein ACD_79C00561G0003 [uncultured bacterium]
MPIDKILIKEKLNKVNQYLERIENMHFSEDQFLENTDYQDLLTFRLQQAIETCIDIATHIISSLNLEKPETARSSFEVLAKHKIITKDVAQSLTFAVSFRNLAVHGYEKFDFKRLFYDYKKDLVDLKRFISVILNILK